MKSFFHYLRAREYYENLYDELTVKDCRITEGIFLKQYPQVKKINFQDRDNDRWITAESAKKDREDYEKLSKKEKEFLAHYNIPKLILYFKTGERYLKREETINEWIKRDEARDQKRESIWEMTHPKTDKRCRQCGDRMKPIHKDFHSIGSEENEDRILFMYECRGCEFREGEFSDGEIWERKKPRCPECREILEESHKRLKTKIKFISICPSCKFKDSWEMELGDKSKKKTPEEIKEENLMERDKLRFCLTEKEGREFAESKSSLERLSKLFEEIDEREASGEMKEKDKEKLEKIGVLEAQKRIKTKLSGKKFLKLKFAEPNMSRDVSCEFKVYEGDSSRDEHNAKKQLKILIEKALKGSNWKLMSDGISCRMGILNGRIRGIESRNYVLGDVTL